VSEKGVQVIDRALDILELLSLEREGLGVTEIGIRLNINKSTVHRIVNALVERGYVEKDTSRLVYKLGLRVLELSSLYLNNVELKTEARTYLWELTNKLGLTTHLGILDGVNVVYIDKIDVVSSRRLYSQIGRRISIHCSALGKSILSGMSYEQCDILLSKCSFERFTDKTMQTKQQVIDQIENYRLKGWYVDDEEHDEGIRCLAAPVYDYMDKVVAAISISGANTLISKQTEDEIGTMLVETARKISKRLGYKPNLDITH
jgi:DNA-binding IclR family transcriptional regulator